MLLATETGCRVLDDGILLDANLTHSHSRNVYLQLDDDSLTHSYSRNVVREEKSKDAGASSVASETQGLRGIGDVEFLFTIAEYHRQLET